MARHMSLTYGVLPTRDQFQRCWNLEVGEGKLFSFGNDPRVGYCELNEEEVWEEVVKAEQEWAQGSDEAGEWCSCVLSVLGVEWV